MFIGQLHIALALKQHAEQIIGRNSALQHHAVDQEHGDLRARVADRIEAQSPGLGVDFDALSVVFEERWQPRFRLDNLRLTLPGSGARLQLDQSTARLSGRALLAGRVEPREITVTGAQLRLKRRADGSFDLIGRAPEGDRSLGDAMAELKSALGRPELAGLSRIEGLGLTLVYEDARAGRRWSGLDHGVVEL